MTVCRFLIPPQQNLGIRILTTWLDANRASARVDKPQSDQCCLPRRRLDIINIHISVTFAASILVELNVVLDTLVTIGIGFVDLRILR